MSSRMYARHSALLSCCRSFAQTIPRAQAAQRLWLATVCGRTHEWAARPCGRLSRSSGAGESFGAHSVRRNERTTTADRLRRRDAVRLCGQLVRGRPAGCARVPQPRAAAVRDRLPHKGGALPRARRRAAPASPVAPRRRCARGCALAAARAGRASSRAHRRACMRRRRRTSSRSRSREIERCCSGLPPSRHDTSSARSRSRCF